MALLSKQKLNAPRNDFHTMRAFYDNKKRSEGKASINLSVLVKSIKESRAKRSEINIT